VKGSGLELKVNFNAGDSQMIVPKGHNTNNPRFF